MVVKVTDEQAAIIAHREGPALILAVAGSGKTTTVLKRIDALVAAGCAPREILLTTFSRSGAADMTRRAQRLHVRRGVEYRTIHSMAWSAIKKAGLNNWLMPPDWWVREVITKAAKDYEVIAENLTRAATKKRQDEARRLVQAGASAIDLAFGLRSIELDSTESESYEVLQVPTAREIKHWISRAKADMVRPDAWEDTVGVKYPGFIEWGRSRGLDFATSRMIDHCYRALETERADPIGRGHKLSGFKKGDVACDHDDALLEASMAARLGRPWINKVKGIFRHVIVDEAQDCNLAQWIFVRWLAHEFSRESESGVTSTWQNLMCIGDDQQAIYEWRGTRAELLADMVLTEGPGLAFYPLTTNFRSGAAIIEVANSILARARKRLFKGELRCGREDIKAEVGFRTFGDAQEEADAVVDRIQQSIALGRKPSEIAVLYRINAMSGPIELELIRRKIPYRVAGHGFFMRPEVDAAVKYIALALDEDDADAYETIYRVPRRWINKQFLKAFPTFSSLRNHKPGELAARWKGATRLVRDMDKLIARLRDDGLVAALEFVFDAIGIREHFAQGGDETIDEEIASEIDDTLRALLACAETAGDPKRFLEFARDMRDGGGVGAQDPDGEHVDNRVTLSTIHRGKGLEWEEVFLIGVSEGLFPLARGNPDEELRLGYVAVTRAKQALRMSCSPRREGDHPRPSRLVYEARLLDAPRAPVEKLEPI